MGMIDRLLALMVAALLLAFGAVLLLNQDSTTLMVQHTERFVAEALQLALYCMVGAGVLGALAGLTVLGTMIAKRRNENLRQRDGAFAMQVMRINGHNVYIDPNKTLSAALIAGPAGIQEIFTADPALHLQHAVARARVSSMQALAPGDAALSSRFGSQYRPARLGGGRLFGNDKEVKVLPPMPPLALPEPEPEPVRRLSLPEVVNQAQHDRIIVGQSAETGELAIFNPAVHGHGGIIGSTGTGKTTGAAFTAVTAAIRAGYHVVILDPDGGQDWGVFRTHAEWMEADRETFPDQIAALSREYLRRADGGQHTPLLVVLEEYGDMAAQLRAIKRSDADSVDNALDAILRRGRRRGVHALFIDQYPQHWSQQVIAGVKWRAVHRLGPHQGAKLEEYNAGKLPDRGAFRYDGAIYESWHAAPAVRALLASIPAPTFTPVIDAQYRVVSNDRSSVPTPPEGGISQERTPQNGAQNVPTGTDESGRWDDVVAAWFASHPMALTGPAIGISDLARAMCVDAEGDEANYEAYKGRAHKLFHEFRNAVRLGNGERIGTDKATEVKP